jgi:DNA-binding NarL/FixJ family response regulator
MTGYAAGPGLLTPRMRQVLALYGAGMAPSAIAVELVVAESTVRHVLEASRVRLEVHSTRAAVVVAIRRGEL